MWLRTFALAVTVKLSYMTMQMLFAEEHGASFMKLFQFLLQKAFGLF